MRFFDWLDEAAEAALVVIISLALTGCAEHSQLGPLEVGPFIPEHPKTCAADPDCRDDEHCGFPAVDTRAICLPGRGDVYAWQREPAR